MLKDTNTDSPFPELSEVQVLAIQEFMRGAGVKTVATRIERDLSTVYRWLRQDEAFIAALAWARRQRVANTLSRLQCAGVSAVNTLHEVMTGKIADPLAAVKVSAAKAILDYMFKGTLAEDMEAFSQMKAEYSRMLEERQASRGRHLKAA